MKIDGLLIDVDSDYAFVGSKELEDGSNLQEMYEALNCGTIDIVTRKIGGTYFDIVCDDEGLFKKEPNVSATDSNGNPALVGNLFICRHDDEGNLVSLNDDDYELIANNMCVIASDGRMYLGVVVDY